MAGGMEAASSHSMRAAATSFVFDNRVYNRLLASNCSSRRQSAPQRRARTSQHLGRRSTMLVASPWGLMYACLGYADADLVL